MYDYLFWKNEAHAPMRFEHALQAHAHEKEWHYFMLIKEKNKKIRWLGSQDWSAFFYGMRCPRTQKAVTLPALPYFMKQSSLLPIKRPVQFRDKHEETQILPMNTVIQHVLHQDEACLLFQWRRLPHKQQQGLLKKAKHPCFQAHRKRDQAFTRYWGSSPRLCTILQKIQSTLHTPFFHSPLKNLEQTSSNHEKESPSQALLDKLSRPMLEVRIRASHPFEAYTRHFHQNHLGHVEWSKKAQNLYLSSEELSGLMLPPKFEQFAHHVDFLQKPYLAPPKQANHYLAEDRKKHLYIVGKTGMGKSSTILKLFQEDVLAGRAIVMMDPHGALVEQALNMLDEASKQRLVYLEPGYQGRSLALNPLEPEGSLALQSSNLVDAFKQIAQESWGPRLEYWLRNSILSLLEIGGAKLEDILKILQDPKAFPLEKISPILQNFWKQEFLTLDKKIRHEACQAIFNKVGPLLTHPQLGPIFQSQKNRFSFHESFEKKQIVLIKLSKAKIGDDGVKFLGMIFLSNLYRSLLHKPLPPQECVSVFLDEMQHFGGASLEHLLAEFRKYGLALTLANQHLSQLEKSLQDSILGNVANMMSFQLSYADAQLLAPSFGLEPEYFCALSPLEAYVKRIHKGENLPVFFHEVSFPPPAQATFQAEAKHFFAFTRKLPKFSSL